MSRAVKVARSRNRLVNYYYDYYSSDFDSLNSIQFSSLRGELRANHKFNRRTISLVIYIICNRNYGALGAIWPNEREPDRLPELVVGV